MFGMLEFNQRIFLHSSSQAFSRSPDTVITTLLLYKQGKLGLGDFTEVENRSEMLIALHSVAGTKKSVL